MTKAEITDLIDAKVHKALRENASDPRVAQVNRDIFAIDGAWGQALDLVVDALAGRGVLAVEPDIER